MLSSQQQAEAHYAGKKHQEVINSNTMKNAFFNAKTGEWERWYDVYIHGFFNQQCRIRKKFIFFVSKVKRQKRTKRVASG